MNVIQPLLHAARLRPDREALVDGERVVRYRELADAGLRAAARLRALGVEPGDRVGVRLGDGADQFVATVAAAALGAVFVPLDWRGRAAEAAQRIDELGVKLVLVEPNSELTNPICLPLDESWHAALARTAPLDRIFDGANAPWLVASTSGTTGAARFVVQSHLQYHFSVAVLAEMMPRGGRYLSSLPLAFGSGRRKAMLHLLRGDTVVLLPPQASAAEYVEAARRHRAEIGAFMPATMRRLLDLAPADRPLLPGMAIACGGTAMTGDEKRAAARRLTPHFFEQFATAVTGTIAMLRPEDIAEHAESVGRTHSYAEIEIVDEADRLLPAGEDGRLRYRGPTVGSALIHAPAGGEPAAEGYRGDWYYTGDLAALDRHGFLYLKGRLAETISRGGSKVHPVEVENRLLEHPAVAEAAVVGRTVRPGEEEIVAFVVARSPVAIGALVAHCRTGLTPYKVPGEIRFVVEMPKNPANKIDKGRLRALLTAGT